MDGEYPPSSDGCQPFYRTPCEGQPPSPTWWPAQSQGVWFMWHGRPMCRVVRDAIVQTTKPTMYNMTLQSPANKRGKWITLSFILHQMPVETTLNFGYLLCLEVLWQSFLNARTTPTHAPGTSTPRHTPRGGQRGGGRGNRHQKRNRSGGGGGQKRAETLQQRERGGEGGARQKAAATQEQRSAPPRGPASLKISHQIQIQSKSRPCFLRAAGGGGGLR